MKTIKQLTSKQLRRQRIIYNKKILKALESFLYENPDQRFTQALTNLDINRSLYNGSNVNEYYTESKAIYERVESQLRMYRVQLAVEELTGKK